MRRVLAVLFFFLVLVLHGATLGLTDDEAYYWVLAQKPALGYAFHPPAVAWSIAVFQKLLGWAAGNASPGLVRLPAAVFSSAIVAMGMAWMEEASEGRLKGGALRGGIALLSFAGFFALSWMMVPDLPLFAGWMLAFWMTWRICFGTPSTPEYLGAFAGTMLAALSKYSGVLVAGSALAAIVLWAPRQRRASGVAWVLGGLVAAVVPILAWNSAHGWGSLLYQFRDRHSGQQLSLLRFLRFWAVEAVVAGPPLLAYALTLPWRLKASRNLEHGRVTKFVAAWAVPAAAVYCVQPLWSDFKPHWAFAVWLPVALELSWAWSRGRNEWWARLQAFWGIPLGLLVLIACHVPVGGWIVGNVSGREPDPRLDVTNDMYGWSRLRTADSGALPIVGGRYQTAAQAAFAVGSLERVTLLPKDLKELEEWPDLRVSDLQGPDWPALTAPVLFVSDNRYTADPGFRDARCRKLERLEERRAGMLAKWIDVWRCDPAGSPL